MRLTPRKVRLKLKRAWQRRLIRGSGLFDPTWYCVQYPDVARSGMDPTQHYLLHGGPEMRTPGPNFDPLWYAKQSPDVVDGMTNPILHYLRHGRPAGLAPRPKLPTEPWWFGLPVAPETPVYARNTEHTPAAGWIDVVRRMTTYGRDVAVVIPVHNAPAALRACLASVVVHTNADVQVIVIDDASTDPEVHDVLQRFAAYANVEVHRNGENLGYTATINAGIRTAGERDVILLNSDTEVVPGWIRRLRLAAYSDPAVATATPLSTNAGAFSAPKIGTENPVPAWLGLDAYARVVSQASLRRYPRTPTGNGFCMYVRRDCLDQVGLFDAEAFPRGYGEENDFCMRAIAAGWTHVVDDATLIHHVRSASFGATKETLLRQGRRIVDDRHPDYERRVRAFTQDPGYAAARDQVRSAIDATAVNTRLPVRPRALFVIATETGGTPQTNRDLMQALADRVEPFILRCTADRVVLSYFSAGVQLDLATHDLDEPVPPFPHRSVDYDAIVAEWLVAYAIEIVHVRHIAWHSLGLFDTCRTLGIPVVFSFHDFYTVCPTVKLLDERGTFCGGTCTPSSGECPQDLWNDDAVRPLKHVGIFSWKQQMDEVLERCDRHITTADSARDVIAWNFPRLANGRIEVIPHGRDFPNIDVWAPEIRSRDHRLRLVVPGNLSFAKGGDIVRCLADRAVTENLEIHVLGNVSEAYKDLPGVIHHGPYLREDFHERISAIRPHVGLVLSVWPETYCHTLTELWSAGVPVLGLDFGAVGERIRETGGGWLVAEPTADAVLRKIQRIRGEPQEHGEKMAAVRTWQATDARQHGTRRMSHAYFDLYRALLYPGLTGQRRIRVAVASTGDRGPDTPGSQGDTSCRLAPALIDRPDRTVRYDVLPIDQTTPDELASYDTLLVADTINGRDADAFLDMASAAGVPCVLDLGYNVPDVAFDKRPTSAQEDSTVSLARATRANMVLLPNPERADALSSVLSDMRVLADPLDARVWARPSEHARSDSLPNGLERRKSQSRELRILTYGGEDAVWVHAGLERALADLQRAGWKPRLFAFGDNAANLERRTTIVRPAKAAISALEGAKWRRKVLEAVDIALVPATDEQFSERAIVECAAAGLPVVALDTPAARRLVANGGLGWVTAGDGECLAAILNRAGQDTEAREAIRDYAPRFARQHRIASRIGQQLDDVIFDLTGATRLPTDLAP